MAAINLNPNLDKLIGKTVAFNVTIYDRAYRITGMVVSYDDRWNVQIAMGRNYIIVGHTEIVSVVERVVTERRIPLQEWLSRH